METYGDGTFSLYFGGKDTALFRDVTGYSNEVLTAALADMQRLIAVSRIVFLRQTHSDTGVVISHEDVPNSFSREGDFLVTNCPGVGIGVLTADCLPVALYDPKQRCAAIVHSGWRGTFARIASRALQAMAQHVGTDPGAVRVFFGPAGRVCCYEVQPDFIGQARRQDIDTTYCVKRDGRLFFDNVACVRSELEAVGVMPNNISDRDAQCTIHNDAFCSHRRQQGKAGRQISMIVINH